MLDLAGRVAFITGGAQGVGLGIARNLAREGVRVALADLDKAALTAAKSELASTTQVETFVLDVGDRDAFGRAADEAEELLGPVSLLCNNAGVGGSYPVKAMTYELWDLFFGTNLGGVINGLQTFLPRMIARGEPGHVVNTASSAGLAPTGRTGFMYEGSKSGVVGLSEGLSKQLHYEGLPIGVSVLCPGPVASNMVANGRGAADKVVTGPLTDEQVAVRESQQAEQESYLRLLGLPPDTVGAMVVDGIKTDRLHIITDRSMSQQMAARAKALFNALPKETEHDRRISRYTAVQIQQLARAGGTLAQ